MYIFLSCFAVALVMENMPLEVLILPVLIALSHIKKAQWTRLDSVQFYFTEFEGAYWAEQKARKTQKQKENATLVRIFSLRQCILVRICRSSRDGDISLSLPPLCSLVFIGRRQWVVWSRRLWLARPGRRTTWRTTSPSAKVGEGRGGGSSSSDDRASITCSYMYMYVYKYLHMYM